MQKLTMLSLAVLSAIAPGCAARGAFGEPALVTSAQPARHPIELIGTAVLPGDTPDRSGLTEPMRGGLAPNLVGSFGSGMCYAGGGAGRENLYYAISDRGPADGAFPFRDRFHLLRIDVIPGDAHPVRVHVEQTKLLNHPQRGPFIGASAAFDPADQQVSTRLDPEAIAVARTGTIWTSDEYGPWLDEWSTEGQHLRRVAPPAKFRIARPAAKAQDEMPPHNTTGRQSNRGFEGLAIAPDGTRLYALMQGPLLQEGGVDEDKRRFGTNVRLLELRLDPGGSPAKPEAWREFVYQLDHPSHGLNEILAINSHTFLVIEKDGLPGARAKVRRIYRVDITDATDVSSVAALPRKGLPPKIKPVSKTLVLDLLDPRFHLAGESMPEKVEALALGPDLPDGRHLLLVATDNDYDLKAPSYIWAFAIDPSALPGVVRQAFTAHPAAAPLDSREPLSSPVAK